MLLNVLELTASPCKVFKFWGQGCFEAFVQGSGSYRYQGSRLVEAQVRGSPQTLKCPQLHRCCLKARPLPFKKKYVYSPPQVDRIWGLWRSCYNIPKAIFCLLD